MRPATLKEKPLTLKVIVFMLASISLMFADYHLGNLQTVKMIRAHLAVVVYPVQYLVDLPVKMGRWLSRTITSRIQLLEENTQLHQENLRLQFTLQKFEDLKRENERLRRLLGSPVKFGERVMVAEVMAVDTDPYSRNSRKMKINKGSHHGVFEGQPVLDAQGVMGQVSLVEPFSSTVMLLTDPEHELPVQVVRTGLRTVAKGMGPVNRLSLLYLPNIGINAGIKVGDLVVTSGLGQQFPKGYPVGTVIEVNPDIGKSHAQVHAIPRAALERNQEVLLVWKKGQ